jgi:hypothetical protein
MIDAVGELDAFFQEAEALGVDWAEALKRGAAGILEVREQILGKKQGLLGDLVEMMTRAGMDGNRLAAERAKIEQQIFLVQLKKLEVELIAFNLMTDALQGILKSLAQWATDVANFLPDVTIKGTGGRSRGGGISKADRRGDLIRFLQGYELDDFTLALLDLNKEFNKAAKEAKKLGIEEERVTRARANAVKSMVEDLFQPIWDLQDEIAVGAGKKPGESFAAMQAKFDEIRERALAGDVEAMREFPDVARSFRDFAAQYWGTSSAAFNSIMTMIESTLAAIAPSQEDVSKALDEATMAQLAALDDIEDVLKLIADLLGGMGLQHGGSVHAGEVQIVGEGGPEFFVAPTGGKVLPFVSRDEEVVRAGMGQAGQATAEITQALEESTMILTRELRTQQESSKEQGEQLEEIKETAQELTRLMRSYFREQETKRRTA